MRRLVAILLAASAASSIPGARPARAEVIDIGADGRVTRLDGPPLSADPGTARPRDAQARRRAPDRARPARPDAALGAEIRSAARDSGLSPALVEAVAWRESGFDPAAVSPKGARGVMQLTPRTARALGVEAEDPAANIRGGAAYLRALLDRYHGDIVRALAAYDAGPGAVDRLGGPPPYAETRAYVAAILDRLAEVAAPGSGRGAGDLRP